MENKGATLGTASAKNMKSKITKSDVSALVGELEEIETWLNPPAMFPPAGYEPHHTQAGYWVRVVSEEILREEIFGSEEKNQWMTEAFNRISQIKEELAGFFFPNPKEEGTERKERLGYAVMLKTGLDRKIDKAALPVVLTECQKMANKQKLGFSIEEKAIDWKPTLRLAEFRELPEQIQKQLEEALTITPKKAEFEIVKLPD
jgi:hypothetical protein